MQLLAYSCVLLSAVLTVIAQQSNAAADAALVAKLITENSQVGRLSLLNDSDFVFNFEAGVGTAKGAGGSITAASATDFPAVIKNGLAMVFAVLEPCGLISPHTHPRASEILFVINGTGIEVGFIEEDGARYVANTVLPGEATVFPKGSIHFQQNLGCEPLALVAVLNDADPGLLSVAQRYFGLPPDIVQASLGDIGIEDVEMIALNIPDLPAIGTQSCLQRCGLTRGPQPHADLQPRVSANAFPPSTSKRSIARRSVEGPIEADSSKSTCSSESESVRRENVVSILRIVVGVMLVGYVFIGAIWISRRRRERVAVVDMPPVSYQDVVKA